MLRVVYIHYVCVHAGLYGCAEVYGTCAQVSMVHCHDNVFQNHVTYESAPVISLDGRVTSTAGSSNHREESVLTSRSPPLRHQFHKVHGHNIHLSRDKIVAKRLQGFDQGLVFSHRVLQPGEIFEVKTCHFLCNFHCIRIYTYILYTV